MVIDPISATVAGVSTILGIGQAQASNAAARQDYVNQSAFSDATAQFNRWQSTFNSRASNLNAQYNYWASTVNHNQELAYTSQLRGYDLAQEIAQAEKVRQTRVGAGVNYVVNSQAISDRFAEEGMQQAVAIQQAQYRMLQTSAAYQAMAGEGRSVDRVVNDFTRQLGDYQTLATINENLRTRQYKRDQLSQITSYLSQYNSQDFFEAQQRMDPIAPFAPLPSIVMPAGPSMKGAPPSSTAAALNIGSAVLGGFNTYLNTASSIKKLGG